MIRYCIVKKSLGTWYYICSVFLIKQFCVALDGPPRNVCLLQDNWRKGMASVSSYADFSDFDPHTLAPDISTSDSSRQSQKRPALPKLISSEPTSGDLAGNFSPREKPSAPRAILATWHQSVSHLWHGIVSWSQIFVGDRPRHQKHSRLVFIPIAVICLPVIIGFCIAAYRCCTTAGKQKKNERANSHQSHQTFLTHTPRALGRRMLFAGVLRHDTPTDLSAAMGESGILPGDEGVSYDGVSQDGVASSGDKQNTAS